MDAFQNTGLPDWDWWGRLWPTPGETLRRLGVDSETTVAEVACGNGYFALPAARITDPNPVYALDIDAAALDELSHLAAQQGIENVEPMLGDARELTQHLPAPVDYVLLANTFHGVDDKAGLVQQAFDSLRPGGHLCIVNWHDRPREATTAMDAPRGPPTELRMAPDETKRVVSDAGDFIPKALVELPPYHYALRFER
ncbi:class I SAM-dependent methyltransferase [Haloferax sp. S1W]|uniref:class I SAM-dependent methyltransferase n=1 Tax=Haloferax sp. S1W TaxID=3377110 RepID=UPI0037C70BEB